MWNVQSLNQTKFYSVLEYLLERDIGIACLSETWFHDDTNYQTSLLEFAGNFSVYSRHRVTETRGGGVCLLMKNKFKSVKQNKGSYTSFESVSLLSCISNLPSQKLKIITIYRRDAIKFSVFLEEFSRFVQNLALSKYPFIIGGDFNVQMNNAGHSYTKRFKRLCGELNLSLTNIPATRTHVAGNTIDFIVCDSNVDSLVLDCSVDFDAPNNISHHYPVVYTLKTALNCRSIAPSKPKRNFLNFDLENLKNDLSYHLNDLQNFTSFENKIDCFQKHLKTCYDKHVPLRLSKIHHNKRPFWMDHEYVVQRALRRKLERTYKRSNSVQDELNFKLQRTKCSLLVNEKIDCYFSNMIKSSNGDSKTIFNLYSKIVGNPGASGPSLLPDVESYGDSSGLANAFNNFFIDKIEKTQHHIDSQLLLYKEKCSNQQPTYQIYENTGNFHNLSQFRPTNTNELKEIILDSTIKTTAILDPLPRDVMSDCIDILLPHLVDLVNSSLLSGSIDGLKFSYVKPLLKNFDLDYSHLSSYRPISNLSFISKLIERVVAKRLNEHMVLNNLHNDSQHGYKANHSTETLLVKFLNDILVAVDRNKGVVVLLIDLSSAFDTVQHSFLLKILKDSIHVTGVALEWFHSFLSGRFQAVVVNGIMSEWLTVTCGVPQGSVLGPILFNIYCRHIDNVFKDCGFVSSSYADDNSALMSFALFNQFNTLYNDVPHCLEKLKEYMLGNNLKINETKTEIIVFGNMKFKQQVTLHGTFLKSGDCIRFADTVKHLGVLFDSLLTFDSHFQKVTAASYSSLRRISSIKNCLSKSNLETLIHAFISSQLDYCNILFVNLPKTVLRKLQRIQNAAIRLIFRVRSRHPVSTFFSELHWLSVEQRVVFKCLLMVYKCIYGLAPNALQNLIVVRNQSNLTLQNIFFNRSKYGKRAFIYYASRYWNNIPANIRCINNISLFKTALKSYLIVNFNEYKYKLFN